jgi:hypothetical protein
MSNNTFRLFKQRNSFVEGFGSLFDYSSLRKRYNTDSTPEEADNNAIHSDWLAVGADLTHAFETYDKQSTKSS